MSQEIRPEFNMAMEYFKTMAELIQMQNKYAIESRITLNYTTLKSYLSVTKQIWIRIRPFVFDEIKISIDKSIKDIEVTLIYLSSLDGKKVDIDVNKIVVQTLFKLDDLSVVIHDLGTKSGQFQPYTIKEGKKEKIMKAFSGEYG